MEYGEKNNSYFLGLEKQRQIKKSINKLIDEQKTKYIDVYRIFANEYIKRINENKTLQKCTFLIK